MSQNQIDILQRALKREKAARKAAEKILEEKSRNLYQTTQKLEALLDEKSSQLQGVFENIVDAYVVMDLKGNVLKLNDAATRLFGYKLNKEALNVFDLIYKDDYQYGITSFMELQSKGYFKNYEARIVTKSQDVKWVHINASVIFDKNKKPVAAQGIVRDITGQKESKQKLIESEDRLSTLILNLDRAVVLEDANRKMVLTNKKFCDFFNIDSSPEDLIGMDCAQASEVNKVLFKDPQAFIDRMSQIVKNKKVVKGDEIEMLDGKILERNYMPIMSGENNKGFLWTFKDVTTIRNYQNTLETQQQKYYNIITNMKLGLVEVDLDDNILKVNECFEEMSGYSEKELKGRHGGEVFLLDDIDREYDKNAKSLKGKLNSYETKVRNKLKERRYWLISNAPNYNVDGESIGSIGVHLDITDLKNLENQKEKLLVKLEKSNNELQEYAHIVSHDLKSPLRSIDALVSWIKEDNIDKLDASSLKNIGLIETTLEKMEQLITDVLDYSSLGSGNSNETSVDLNSLVNDLKTILYVPEHITINTLKLLPVINGDKIKLQQVFQNLISNAIKFIDKPTGIIDIDVQDMVSHYKFSVKDNGIGIEKKFHDKIFKIFNTLNKSKDSTGIGLSIVKKVVDLYEGKIWIESQINIGTTFYFTLKK